MKNFQQKKKTDTRMRDSFTHTKRTYTQRQKLYLKVLVLEHVTFGTQRRLRKVDRVGDGVIEHRFVIIASRATTQNKQMRRSSITTQLRETQRATHLSSSNALTNARRDASSSPSSATRAALRLYDLLSASSSSAPCSSILKWARLTTSERANR